MKQAYNSINMDIIKTYNLPDTDIKLDIDVD